MGSALVEVPTAVTDFYDFVGIERIYYFEGERLLRDTLGAHRVFIFDYGS